MAMGLEGFDVRPVFVAKLLNQSGVSPLTGQETTIAKNKDVLLKIEEEYAERFNNNLLGFLNKLSPYVSYRDSIFFLLDCEEENMTVTAIETLEAAYDRGKKLNPNDLMDIMRETIETGIYPSLLVNLLGEEEPEDDEIDVEALNKNLNNLNHLKNMNGSNASNGSKISNNSGIFNKSGLNLDGMRDFK